MSKIPYSEWTPEKVRFDKIITLLNSKHQMNRIEGRLRLRELQKEFTKEQLDAMWERIK